MFKINTLARIALAALIPFANVYACSYTNNGDGTLTDSTTDLVWQQDRAGAQTGSADWYEAMVLARNDRFLGKADWRLPTNDELKRFMASGCWNGKNNYYWSATTNDPNGFIAYMKERHLATSHPMRGSGAAAVLVRGGSTADQTVFDSQFEAKIAPLLKKQEQARQAQMLREREDALAQARADKERSLAQAKFQEAISSKSPQKMYISAGTYDRNGDGYRATLLYEAIISRFPDSNWAVKASDQLSAKHREGVAKEAINSANRGASRRAHQQCKIEMASCYSRGGKDCYRDCDSLL